MNKINPQKQKKTIILFCLLLLGFYNLKAQDRDSMKINNNSNFERLDSLKQNYDLIEKIKEKDFNFIGIESWAEVIQKKSILYENNLGSFGQLKSLNNISIGRVNVLIDGVQLKNNLLGTFDFNNLQFNNIENHTQKNLLRGFLYGNTINDYSVNFTSERRNEKEDLTILNYMQGSNEDAAINVFFNKRIVKNLSFSFDVTNKATPSNYTNSEYEQWLVYSKLNYKYDEDLNFQLIYNYSKGNVQINGGVDYDSLAKNYSANDIEEIFFNSYLAPVIWPSTYRISTFHSFIFNTNYLLNKQSKLKSSIYYNNDLNQFRQNLESNSYSRTIPKEVYENNSKSAGINLNYLYLNDLFKLEVLGNINEDVFFINSKEEVKQNSVSLAGIFSTDILSFVDLSVYSRILSTKNYQAFGFGFDIKKNIFENATVYFGISSYQKPASYFENHLSFNKYNLTQRKNYSFGINYNTKQFNFSLEAYNSNSNNSPTYYSFAEVNQSYYTDSISVNINNDVNTFGLMFSSYIKWWHILFEFDGDYSKTDVQFATQLTQTTAPIANLTAGLFYTDKVFSNNLLFKTGFLLHYYGNKNPMFYNYKYISEVMFYKNSVGGISPISTSFETEHFITDFYFAGNIKKTAKVFFIIENLLDTNYFVIPFFPKESRNFILGIKWNLYN